MSLHRATPDRSLPSVYAAEPDWDGLYADQLPSVNNYFRFRVGADAEAEDLRAQVENPARSCRYRSRTRNIRCRACGLLALAPHQFSLDTMQMHFASLTGLLRGMISGEISAALPRFFAKTLPLLIADQRGLIDRQLVTSQNSMQYSRQKAARQPSGRACGSQAVGDTSLSGCAPPTEFAMPPWASCGRTACPRRPHWPQIPSSGSRFRCSGYDTAIECTRASSPACRAAGSRSRSCRASSAGSRSVNFKACGAS